MYVIINFILGLMLVPFLMRNTSKLEKMTFVLFCATFSPILGVPMYWLFKRVIS